MTATDYDQLLTDLQDRAESLPDVWSGPVVECIKTRIKWNDIARKFPVLKDQHGYDRALRILAKEYHYSVQNIDKIITQKNPYKEIGKH